MKKTIRAMLIALGVLLPTQVLGEICYPVKAMEEILATKFEQTVVIVGLVEEDVSFRFYASAETREWTVVVFYSSKRACAILAGSDLDIVRSDDGSDISLSPEVIEMFRELLLGRDA